MMRTSLTELSYNVARASLEVHRLARAVDEVRFLRSPITSSRSEDGIPRPTEDTALCPRRSHVSDTVHDVLPCLDEVMMRLEHALDVWDGRKAP